LVLTAGEHYFIGFRNVKDLWASHSYDGVPLPIYYGYDNDGTYPFTENGDVEYAMLKFQGTHIHPLRVPADYPTIQAAIDAAVDGDIVLVADGTYTGEGNRDIDFLGKAITVRSIDPNAPNIVAATVIDCEGHGRGFYFHNGEDANSVVDGFTVVNGYGRDGGAVYFVYSSPALINCVFKNSVAERYGGCMYFDNSSPTITNCTVSDNESFFLSGGGICLWRSDPIIRNCIFSGNLVRSEGGAICLWDSDPAIIGCSIIGNSAYDQWSDGGGIKCWGSDPTIVNCTIYGNYAVRGGGIASGYYARPTVVNCIMWDNARSEISGGGYSISYSNVKGGYTGEGNIDTDPYFADPCNGDYHLLPYSPCIDTGDPNYIPEPNETDLDGHPRIIGGRIDMGAYESPVPAEVRIVPRTINLASKGKWITCYISLPEDYNVADIDPNSVLLEDEIQPDEFSADEQKQVAVLRFNREELRDILNVGRAELTITGRLTDGTIFEGTDTIKVIDKAGKK